MNAHTVPGGHPRWDDDTPVLIGQAVEVHRPDSEIHDGVVTDVYEEIVGVHSEGWTFVARCQPEHLRRIGGGT